jgi:hypothetical protein
MILQAAKLIGAGLSTIALQVLVLVSELFSLR